jgi:hypothetical protein
MPGPPSKIASDWEEKLYQRLEIFVDIWRPFEGSERSGAQDFLRRLLDIYDVSYRPGTLFEQHPLRMPARGTRAAQTSLFPGEQKPVYTTESMDMYLPKVCVWEMKSPAEKDLGKHHGQILGYWARVRTRYMVLCNFHEFWIYDTNDQHGQLEPKLRFRLDELPARADALLFLRGSIHNDLEQGRPAELRTACDALNDAVTACYGFPEGTWRDDRESLRLLLELNQQLAGA